LILPTSLISRPAARARRSAPASFNVILRRFLFFYQTRINDTESTYRHEFTQQRKDTSENRSLLVYLFVSEFTSSVASSFSCSYYYLFTIMAHTSWFVFGGESFFLYFTMAHAPLTVFGDGGTFVGYLLSSFQYRPLPVSIGEGTSPGSSWV
jgi:hypothetical protein